MQALRNLLNICLHTSFDHRIFDLYVYKVTKVFKRTVFQCSRKLPTLYRTFGQTESESLSDRLIFCLTEKQSVRFGQIIKDGCVCVCVGGGGGGGRRGEGGFYS